MIASLSLALLLTGTDQAALHAAAASTCAAFELRSTGTIHYFCDCQAGAQAGCVAGDDRNLGTTPAAPKQTWAAANALFGTMPGGDTSGEVPGALAGLMLLALLGAGRRARFRA